MAITVQKEPTTIELMQAPGHGGNMAVARNSQNIGRLTQSYRQQSSIKPIGPMPHISGRGWLP